MSCAGNVSQWRGVAKDNVEALRWFRKSAEQGDARAQYNLGVMCYEGFGVVEDFEEAVRWFRKAAGQGDKAAQEALRKLNLDW